MPNAIKLCSLRERTVQTDLEVLTDSFCSCGSSSSLSDSYRSHDDGEYSMWRSYACRNKANAIACNRKLRANRSRSVSTLPILRSLCPPRLPPRTTSRILDLCPLLRRTPAAKIPHRLSPPRRSVCSCGCRGCLLLEEPWARESLAPPQILNPHFLPLTRHRCQRPLQSLVPSLMPPTETLKLTYVVLVWQQVYFMQGKTRSQLRVTNTLQAQVFSK